MLICSDAHRGQKVALDPSAEAIDSCDSTNEGDGHPTQGPLEEHQTSLRLNHLGSPQTDVLTIASQSRKLMWNGLKNCVSSSQCPTQQNWSQAKVIAVSNVSSCNITTTTIQSTENERPWST